MRRNPTLPLLALASIGACAQAADVQIYATLLPFLESVRTTGATPAGLTPALGGATQVPGSAYTGLDLPSRLRITSGTSNLGFRGAWKLGDDLQVFWQIENAISPDGDAPNTLAGRNSAVGLKGSWGTAFYGNWDTPYKFPLLAVGPLRGLSPFDNALTANPGFNVPGTTTQSGRVNGKADAAFNRRQGNSIQYWSPVWNGFSARVGVSVDEGKTVATATAPSVSPTILSGLVTYAQGPVKVSFGFERHTDYFGLSQLGGNAGATLTNNASSDTGQELVASYAFSTGTKVSAVVEQLTYETDDTAAGALRQYKRTNWYTLVQQQLGRHQVWAAFGRGSAGSAQRNGGAAASTDGLEGTQWSAGYSYAIAKNVDLFTSYYGMTNGRSGTLAEFPPVGTVAPGANTTGMGLGLLITF